MPKYGEQNPQATLFLTPGPQPRREVIREAEHKASPRSFVYMEFAPKPPEIWVGREELLSVITFDWLDSETYVTGLVGFAGEGKSSIARRWVDELSDDQLTCDKPDGIFWWSFYNKNSTVDLFFEKALSYLGSDELNLDLLPSAHSRAEFLAGMLRARRYLFVLDGLERLQYLGGEDYGLLRSNDLAKFLEYFAAGGHQSFCLITSRARLTNLIPYRTYTQFEIDGLSEQDGYRLLKELGVKGDENELLQQVRTRWGHALALTLLANHLVKHHEGEEDGGLYHAGRVPPNNEKDNKSYLVQRVMEPYDRHLAEEERKFMRIFCLFRLPVSKSAIKPVFQVELSIAERLTDYYLLRYDPDNSCYTTHPLIREFYLRQLENQFQGKSFLTDDLPQLRYHKHESIQIQPIHRRIKDYYLSLAEEIPPTPSLDELSPVIEAIHHLCQAGDFDEASRVRLDSTSKGLSLIKEFRRLGAYETELILLQEFFPNNNISLEPQVSASTNELSILFEVGESLTNLGRMAEALPAFERFNQLALDSNSQESVIKGCLSLAKLYTYLGKLSDAEKAANEALALARKTENVLEDRASLIYLGLVAYLRGELAIAGQVFQRAQTLEPETYEGKPFLYGIQGVIYADYLRRLGDDSNIRQARFVIEANLRVGHQELDDRSRLYRVLGDLDAAVELHENAAKNYAEAIKIVRGITHWPALTGILSARGRWMAQGVQDVEAARSDLEEALDYAVTGGYRLYKADIYVGLAWADYVDNNFSQAQRNATQAMILSEEMGYFWGHQEAVEVISRIEHKVKK